LECNPVPKTFYKSKKPSMQSRKKFSKEVKQKAMELYNGLCGVCKVKTAVDPHHIRFKSDSGKGVINNCLPVCRECHIKIHKNDELAMRLRVEAKKRHGTLYWTDEWDKEWMK